MTHPSDSGHVAGAGGPAEPPRLTKADLLVKLGGVLFVAGFAAVIGVLVAGDSLPTDTLIAVAMVLVPVGFCVAAAGLVVQVRARLRGSRADVR